MAVVWFFRTLFIHPELRVPASVRSLKGQIRAAISHTEQNDPKELSWQKQYELQRAEARAHEKSQLVETPDAATLAKYYSQSKAAQERLAKIRALLQTSKAKGEIRLGLYVDWDPNSFASLEKHAGALTHVAPEWFTLQGTESRLVVEIEQRLVPFAGSRGITLMPFCAISLAIRGSRRRWKISRMAPRTNAPASSTNWSRICSRRRPEG